MVTDVVVGVNRSGTGWWSGAAIAGVDFDRAAGGTGASPRSKRSAMIAADLANVQVWVATTPIDMAKARQSVRSGPLVPGADPLSGNLFRVP